MSPRSEHSVDAPPHDPRFASWRAEWEAVQADKADLRRAIEENKEWGIPLDEVLAGFDQRIAAAGK